MATLQTMREGGTQHPEDILNFLTSRIVKGTGGVFDKDSNNSFLVEEENTPAMSVKVNDGYAFVRESSDSMVYPVRLYDGDASVSISNNASGNDRVDALVLYIDLGESSNSAVTNVAKLTVVKGTPAGSPTAPTDNDIETEIGANNPYLRLADIDVSNGAVSIVDADITDQRTEVVFRAPGVASDGDDLVNKDYYDNNIPVVPSATTTTEGKIELATESEALAGSDANRAITPSTLLATLLGGWNIYSDVVPTRASADDPTYVLTFAGVDLTDRINVGDRIRWTQNGTVRYAIVTAISFSTNTTLTVYGGTQYDVLDTGSYAISDFYFSHQRSPVGFPMRADYWTEEVSSTSDMAMSVGTTAYQDSGIDLSLPIGAWNVSYRIILNADTDKTDRPQTATNLDTAGGTSNLLGDEFETYEYIQFSGNANYLYAHEHKVDDKFYRNTTKKTLNIAVARGPEVNDTFYIRGSYANTYIRAVCAYL